MSGAWRLRAGLLGACLAGSCAAPSGGPGPATAGATDGSGRAILETACTTCHDLGGLDAFKGYYGPEQWRDLVATMIGHGAELDDGQVDVLVDYLADAYGPQAR